MNTASGFSDPLVSDTPLPFHELCARIHDRITTFLDAKNVSDRVKNVQEQTRASLQVIGEALERYRWVMTMWGKWGSCEADSCVDYQSYHYHTMAAKTVLFCSFSTSVPCIGGA